MLLLLLLLLFIFLLLFLFGFFFATCTETIFWKKTLSNKVYSWSLGSVIRQNVIIQILFPEINIYCGKKTRSRLLLLIHWHRCLVDMECLESAVPANFVSYMPTFFLNQNKSTSCGSKMPKMSSLSETRRGWKFGLTPLPSLREKGS